MTSQVTDFLNLDFKTFIQSVFVIIAVVVAIYELVGKFSTMIHRPVSWVRNKNKDHELLLQTAQEVKELKEQHDESVRQSIRHDEMIREDLQKLSDTVDGIVNTLADMQTRDNTTKLKELKDDLVGYFNRYKNIGEWTRLEKDAFWDLFDDYESRGGDGYIHSIVEPVMRELREID